MYVHVWERGGHSCVMPPAVYDAMSSELRKSILGGGGGRRDRGGVVGAATRCGSDGPGVYPW